MQSRSDDTAATTAGATAETADPSTFDPFLVVLKVLPYSILRTPRTRLKLPSAATALPSPSTVLSLLLLTYLAVISGFVYDVIVEPPGIGSTLDPRTGAVKPVVFMPGRVNGQYIIEGISSGFMFLLGGIGLILMDLALDKNRARSVRVSLAAFGISAVVIGYVMAMLLIRIKVPSYLW